MKTRLAGPRATISISSRNLPAIRRLRDEVQRLLALRAFRHPKSAYLFARDARMEMEKLGRVNANGHIHWDNSRRTIHVFGSAAQQRAAEGALERLIGELEGVQWRVTLRLRGPALTPAQAAEVRQKAEQAAGGGAKALRLFQLQRRFIVVSGKAAAIDAVRDVLRQDRRLAEFGPGDGGGGPGADANLCLVCGCPAEKPAALQCGHKVCSGECVDLLLNREDCVAEGSPAIECCVCRPGAPTKRLAWTDIQANTRPDVLMFHVGNAVRLAMERQGMRACPNGGCPQLLRTADARDGHLACNVCRRSWCLQCSAEQLPGRPAVGHDGEQCAQYQARLRDDAYLAKLHVRRLADKIENEILPLACPRCKHVRGCPDASRGPESRGGKRQAADDGLLHSAVFAFTRLRRSLLGCCAHFTAWWPHDVRRCSKRRSTVVPRSTANTAQCAQHPLPLSLRRNASLSVKSSATRRVG
jgi:hypothetical protein